MKDGGSRVRKRDVRMDRSSGQSDVIMALKMEKGVMSRIVRTASFSRRRQRTKVQKEHDFSDTLMLAP